MYKILKKEIICPDISKFVIEAPDIAEQAKPGQFIVVRIDQKGERIPLTICGSDKKAGTITMIFQQVGKTTKHLACLKEGDSLSDVLGPLGIPSEIEKYGKVVCVGGGVGIAEILPIADALTKAGNHVTSILGTRCKDLIFFEKEIANVSKKIYITTDDGSYGIKGFVTTVLADLLKKEKYDMVFAVGPIPMMKKVAEVTKELGARCRVSLNANMLDATGMCGTCRVMVGGKKKFTCVHGPEFDAHQVDFKDLATRANRFLEQEKTSMDLFGKHKCSCHKKGE